MKVTGYCGARYVPEQKAIVLYPQASDLPVIAKLFAAKARREEREGHAAYPEFTLELGARAHTWKQQKAIWALITIIYQSMHGEKPTNEEKYELYLDCLDLYAEKTPNRFTGALRAVHLSESDVMQAAYFIGHLMAVLVEYCDLETDLQTDVRTIFYRWAEWRGEQARDPLDYDEAGELLSYEDWRKKHPVSDASGVGGYLEKCHIVSRGADATMITDVRNLLMLTADEHRFQHQYGWDKFLGQYPHLKGRVLRARSIAGKG